MTSSELIPKIAFSTLGCPDWSWRQIVEKGLEYRYDGVEVRQVAGETDLLKVPEFRPTQRAHRRRELESAGFAICGLSSSVRFDDPDADKRQTQLSIGRAYLEMGAELGAGFVRVFGDVLPERADDAQRTAVVSQIADGLNRLGEVAARCGVDVLLETHGDFAQSCLVAELFGLIESPAVGVLWDTHHPWRFHGESPGQTYRVLRRWVRHTHWKDSVTRRDRPTGPMSPEQTAAAARAHALMSGHRPADYVLFGDGEFPADECASLLKGDGYARWLSLEWEKMWHPQLERPEIAFPSFSLKIRALWSRSTPDVRTSDS